MPRPLPALVATLIAAGLPAQQPTVEKPEPVALVSHAEKLLKQKDKEVEDAALLLWQALDLLATLPSNPVNDATMLSARFLLQENDPREPERRRVFTAVATQQLELAAAYRTRKWLEIAAGRLAVADRYDRDAGGKERAALDAAKPKAKPADPATTAAKSAAPAPSLLLQRGYAQFTAGSWTANGECLVTAALAKTPPVLEEWITKTPHQDHEIVVEVKPTAAGKAWNAAIAVGLHRRDGDGHFSGWRCYCTYDAEHKDCGLFVWEVIGMQTKLLASSVVPFAATSDGFHRLSVQVNGTGLRLQLDAQPPLPATASVAVRGVIGLMHGLENCECGGVMFRNFRIDPLPANAPTDEELRAKTETDNQNAITKAVDDAKNLLGKKQPEAASLCLREALRRVDEMAEGVLRDNLKKTIDAMLVQADPLAPKRQKAAQTIASDLGGLADTYATAGWVRAALVLTEHAATFDPESQTARQTAMREKVTQWNVTQASARANELQPPADDGTQLREWFAKGRKLDTSIPGMVVEGAVARAELGMGGAATWLPHPLAKTSTKASIHVRLPANGTVAGLYFDIVDHTQLGLVVLERRAAGLRFAAWAKLAGKWVPLLQRTLPMDAWRVDGWHQITIEANDTGLVARCSTAEIKVARKMLGKATGTFGLHAENESKDTAVIEFRAFQPGQ